VCVVCKATFLYGVAMCCVWMVWECGVGVCCVLMAWECGVGAWTMWMAWESGVCGWRGSVAEQRGGVLEGCSYVLASWRRETAPTRHMLPCHQPRAPRSKESSTMLNRQGTTSRGVTPSQERQQAEALLCVPPRCRTMRKQRRRAMMSLCLHLRATLGTRPAQVAIQALSAACRPPRACASDAHACARVCASGEHGCART